MLPSLSYPNIGGGPKRSRGRKRTIRRTSCPLAAPINVELCGEHYQHQGRAGKPLEGFSPSLATFLVPREKDRKGHYQRYMNAITQLLFRVERALCGLNQKGQRKAQGDTARRAAKADFETLRAGRYHGEAGRINETELLTLLVLFKTHCQPGLLLFLQQIRVIQLE